MRETNGTLSPNTVVIRSAVVQSGCHVCQRSKVDGATVGPQYSGYPAQSVNLFNFHPILGDSSPGTMTKCPSLVVMNALIEGLGEPPLR